MGTKNESGDKEYYDPTADSMHVTEPGQRTDRSQIQVWEKTFHKLYKNVPYECYLHMSCHM